MGFPAFMIIILFIVVLLIASLAVYLYIYKRKINRILVTGTSGAKMPAPYKVAAILTVVLLVVGIIVSYFVGYKVAYDRFENGMGQFSPLDIHTFYAEVKEVTPSSIAVEGIALNDEQYCGTMQYDIWAETNVVSGNEVISVSDLAQGNMVAITLVSGAGDITDVFKIQLLQ